MEKIWRMLDSKDLMRVYVNASGKNESIEKKAFSELKRRREIEKEREAWKKRVVEIRSLFNIKR